MKQGFSKANLATAQGMADNGASVEEISAQFQVWEENVKEYIDFPDDVTVTHRKAEIAQAEADAAEKVMLKCDEEAAAAKSTYDAAKKAATAAKKVYTEAAKKAGVSVGDKPE